MRFSVLLCIFFITATFQLYAQADMMERKKLYELLEQRKNKFEDYSISLERKSGIFGNKTKADMQLSNEVLTDIVKMDNEIIRVLNRAIDFKSFERVNQNYVQKENSAQLQNLLHATDTLSKQVSVLSDKNKKLSREVQWLKIVNRSLLFLMIIGLIWVYKKRKRDEVSKS